MNPKNILKIVLLLAVYCLPVIALAGCKKNEIVYPNMLNEEWKLLPPQEARGVVGRSDPLIPDVGQPIGFEPLVKQSQSSILGNAREVKHVYQGRAALQDVIDFYRHQLDLNGWKMGNDEHQDDGFALNRTKGPERLRILMYGQGDRITVVIMIGPIYNVPASSAAPDSAQPNPNLGSNN
jgi:hypothetical protein